MLRRVPDASSWGHVVLGRKEKGEKYPDHLCSWYISSLKKKIVASNLYFSQCLSSYISLTSFQLSCVNIFLSHEPTPKLFNDENNCHDLAPNIHSILCKKNL